MRTDTPVPELYNSQLKQNQMLPDIHIIKEMVLPDDDQWRFRFNIESATSNRLYVIAQHKKKHHWGCSCPRWKTRRTCKHLTAMGLPGKEQPFEVNFIND
jgi:hypothetical protein